MARIKLEDIRQIVEQNNWQLISDSYSNLDTEMEFKCSEGHQVFAPWKRLRNNLECPICNQNKLKSSSFKVIPKTKQTRTLGIDQASHISGWSVYDGKQLVAYGVYTAADYTDEIKRDIDVKNWLHNMVTNWQPDIIGIEGIQYEERMGVTTFQALARLQGILMAYCEEQHLSYSICPVATWRAHCGVKGKTRADRKRSMQLLAKQWYDVTITEDEADAIGIGKYTAEKCNRKIEYINWE